MKKNIVYIAIALPIIYFLYISYSGVKKSISEQAPTPPRTGPRNSIQGPTKAPNIDQGEINPNLVPVFIPGKQ